MATTRGHRGDVEPTAQEAEAPGGNGHVPTPEDVRLSAEGHRPASRHQMHEAAERTVDRHTTHVRVPLLGDLELPARDELAFLAGVGALAAIGALEWPVAVAVAAGHALTASHRNNAVKEFGEALESA